MDRFQSNMFVRIKLFKELDMETKLCKGPLCLAINSFGVVKSINEFGWKKKKEGVRASYCRECQRHYGKKHYKGNPQYYLDKAIRNKEVTIGENRKLLIKYLLEHPCVDCGESNPTVLEFDHVRDEKTKNISVMLCNGWSWEAMLKEIQKCDVRCANCHRIRTAREQWNWWGFALIEELTNGTVG